MRVASLWSMGKVARNKCKCKTNRYNIKRKKRRNRKKQKQKEKSKDNQERFKTSHNATSSVILEEDRNGLAVVHAADRFGEHGRNVQHVELGAHCPVF